MCDLVARSWYALKCAAMLRALLLERWATLYMSSAERMALECLGGRSLSADIERCGEGWGYALSWAWNWLRMLGGICAAFLTFCARIGRVLLVPCVSSLVETTVWSMSLALVVRTKCRWDRRLALSKSYHAETVTAFDCVVSLVLPKTAYVHYANFSVVAKT